LLAFYPEPRPKFTGASVIVSLPEMSITAPLIGMLGGRQLHVAALTRA
jgi:hypothetical protein